MKIGYTSGVFDLFHVGHVNLLRNARSLCDKLIVGVTVDSLVTYKGKNCVIPYEERIQVVRSCQFVDLAIPQTSIDKISAVKKLHATSLFVGDDWYDHPSWLLMEEKLKELNCSVFYFPYTQGVSSTIINSTLEGLRD